MAMIQECSASPLTPSVTGSSAPVFKAIQTTIVLEVISNGRKSDIINKVLTTVVCVRTKQKPRNIIHSYFHLMGKALAGPT